MYHGKTGKKWGILSFIFQMLPNGNFLACNYKMQQFCEENIINNFIMLGVVVGGWGYKISGLPWAK